MAASPAPLRQVKWRRAGRRIVPEDRGLESPLRDPLRVAEPGFVFALHEGIVTIVENVEGNRSRISVHARDGIVRAEVVSGAARDALDSFLAVTSRPEQRAPSLTS